MEWAVCSSPCTLQDGNLFWYRSVSSGELLQVILSSAKGTGRQKRCFQGCPLTVYVGAQRLTQGVWSPEIAPWALRGVPSPQPYLRFNTILEQWTPPLFRTMGLKIHGSEHPLPRSQWQGSSGLSFVGNLSYWDREDQVVKWETPRQWRGTKSR